MILGNGGMFFGGIDLLYDIMVTQISSSKFKMLHKLFWAAKILEVTTTLSRVTASYNSFHVLYGQGVYREISHIWSKETLSRTIQQDHAWSATFPHDPHSLLIPSGFKCTIHFKSGIYLMNELWKPTTYSNNIFFKWKGIVSHSVKISIK